MLSRVCEWYLLFTILGECVMSSEMGRRPKLRLTVAQHEKIKYIYIYTCVGRNKMGVDPLSG